MDPSLLCKIFFCLGTAVDIGGTLIPSFRTNIMNYGSRGASQPTATKAPIHTIRGLFDYVASFQVPHTWFTHYYVVSVLSSFFWAYQIYSHGPVLEFLASHSKQRASSMTVNQVFMAWAFMTAQGLRRLYESIALTKPSQSKMWIGLWALGIAYYIFMGISIWIEGIDILNQELSLENLSKFSRPSMKTLIAIPMFLVASAIQHDCHTHLASLKKYTLPQHRFFKYVVCPHYTSECVIYIAITIVAAPGGQMVNKTVLAGLGFVASNLAVTADSAMKWYVEKFGAEKVNGKMRMVPVIY